MATPAAFRPVTADLRRPASSHHGQGPIGPASAPVRELVSISVTYDKQVFYLPSSGT